MAGSAQRKIQHHEPNTFVDGTPCLTEAQIGKIIEFGQRHPGRMRSLDEIRFIDSIADLPVNWRLSKKQNKWLHEIAIRLDIPL